MAGRADAVSPPPPPAPPLSGLNWEPGLGRPVHRSFSTLPKAPRCPEQTGVIAGSVLLLKTQGLKKPGKQTF